MKHIDLTLLGCWLLEDDLDHRSEGLVLEEDIDRNCELWQPCSISWLSKFEQEWETNWELSDWLVSASPSGSYVPTFPNKNSCMSCLGELSENSAGVWLVFQKSVNNKPNSIKNVINILGQLACPRPIPHCQLYLQWPCLLHPYSCMVPESSLLWPQDLGQAQMIQCGD